MSIEINQEAADFISKQICSLNSWQSVVDRAIEDMGVHAGNDHDKFQDAIERFNDATRWHREAAMELKKLGIHVVTYKVA